MFIIYINDIMKKIMIFYFFFLLFDFKKILIIKNNFLNFYKVADDNVMSAEAHECLDDTGQIIISAFIEDMNNERNNESKFKVNLYLIQ